MNENEFVFIVLRERSLAPRQERLENAKFAQMNQ